MKLIVLLGLILFNLLDQPAFSQQPESLTDLTGSYRRSPETFKTWLQSKSVPVHKDFDLVNAYTVHLVNKACTAELYQGGILISASHCFHAMDLFSAPLDERFEQALEIGTSVPIEFSYKKSSYYSTIARIIIDDPGIDFTLMELYVPGVETLGIPRHHFSVEKPAMDQTYFLMGYGGVAKGLPAEHQKESNIAPFQKAVLLSKLKANQHLRLVNYVYTLDSMLYGGDSGGLIVNQNMDQIGILNSLYIETQFNCATITKVDDAAYNPIVRSQGAFVPFYAADYFWGVADIIKNWDTRNWKPAHLGHDEVKSRIFKAIQNSMRKQATIEAKLDQVPQLSEQLKHHREIVRYKFEIR